MIHRCGSVPTMWSLNRPTSIRTLSGGSSVVQFLCRMDAPATGIHYLTSEAEKMGATIIHPRVGGFSALSSKAKTFAKQNGSHLIPFGMDQQYRDPDTGEERYALITGNLGGVPTRHGHNQRCWQSTQDLPRPTQAPALGRQPHSAQQLAIPPMIIPIASPGDCCSRHPTPPPVRPIETLRISEECGQSQLRIIHSQSSNQIHLRISGHSNT